MELILDIPLFSFDYLYSYSNFSKWEESLFARQEEEVADFVTSQFIFKATGVRLVEGNADYDWQ